MSTRRRRGWVLVKDIAISAVLAVVLGLWFGLGWAVADALKEALQ